MKDFERILSDTLRRTAMGMHPPASLEKRVLVVWGEGKRKRLAKRVVSWRRTAATASAVVLILLGGPLAVGMRSPDAARVLSHIPVIGSILNLFGVPNLAMSGVANAVDHGFGIPVGQSVTDQGITLTVENAYYDRRQVWWGMTESFASNAPARPAMSSSDARAYLNGRLLGVNAWDKKAPLRIRGELQGGDFQPASGGRYAGIVGDFLPGLYPPSAHMTVSVRQVGDVKGNWTFHFTLPSAKVETATHTLHPMASRSFDGLTLSIGRVTVGPATITLEGWLATPAAQTGVPQFNLAAFDPRGRMIGVGQPSTNPDVGTASWSGPPVVRGGQKIWNFYANIDAPAHAISSLRVVPYAEPWVLDLAMPARSETFASGSQVSYAATASAVDFTRVDYLPHATRVYYETRGDQYAKPNFYDLELVEWPQTLNRSKPREVRATRHVVMNTAKHLAYLQFPAIQNPSRYSLIPRPMNRTFAEIQSALAMKGLALDISLR